MNKQYSQGKAHSPGQIPAELSKLSWIKLWLTLLSSWILMMAEIPSLVRRLGYTVASLNRFRSDLLLTTTVRCREWQSERCERWQKVTCYSLSTDRISHCSLVYRALPCFHHLTNEHLQSCIRINIFLNRSCFLLFKCFCATTDVFNVKDSFVCHTCWFFKLNIP